MRTRSRVPWPRTAHPRCRTSKSLPGLSEGVWGVDVTPHIPLQKIRGTQAKLERARTKLSLPERTKADWPLTRGAFFCSPENASLLCQGNVAQLVGWAAPCREERLEGHPPPPVFFWGWWC